MNTDDGLNHLDPNITIESRVKEFVDCDFRRDFQLETPLLNVVAAGRLYVLNGKGEFEQVKDLSFWRDGEIRTVCSDGYEWDEDGTITRDWRSEHGT